MSTLRFQVVSEAFKKKALAVTAPGACTSEYYGRYVFGKDQMSKYLSKETLKVIQDVIEGGRQLDREIANHVAAGMKMWAMEMGATHYTHWFQPLTEGTAEKHGKFDEEVVLKGTRFCFEMEMIPNSIAFSKCKELIRLLQVLSSDVFRIGSGSRSGFGEISVISIKAKGVNLTIPEQRKWYLEKSSSLSEEWEGCKEHHLTKPSLKGWTEYKIEGLQPVDFMLFGSGFGNDQGDMTFVRESFVKWDNDKAKIKHGSEKQADGREQVNVILIPASSIKGALAHRVAFHYNKKVGNVIMSDGVIGTGKTAEEVTGKKNPAVKAIFGSEGEKNEKTQEMEDKQRGNFLMSDIIKSPNPTTQPKILNHVSIDRFTGGAIDGALFSEETLYANSECFEFTMFVNEQAFKDIVEKEEKVKGENIQDALETALQDICTGMLPLGGGVNRGNGSFEKGKLFKNGELIYGNN